MDWQTPVVLLIVVVAAGAVLRRAARVLRPGATGMTDGCASCPSRGTAQPSSGQLRALPVVQLDASGLESNRSSS